MNIIKELITDRQKADVDRLEYLTKKCTADENGFDNLTADEKREWFGKIDVVYFSDGKLVVCTDGVLEILGNSPKGGYNCADLNRVGEAIIYVACILNSVGRPVRPTVRTDWQKGDLFYPSDLQNYLDNVEKLRNALAVWETTPQTPPDFNSPERANHIERIVEDVHEVLMNMIAAYRYCGTFYAGE